MASSTWPWRAVLPGRAGDEETAGDAERETRVRRPHLVRRRRDFWSTAWTEKRRCRRRQRRNEIGFRRRILFRDFPGAAAALERHSYEAAPLPSFTRDSLRRPLRLVSRRGWASTPFCKAESAQASPPPYLSGSILTSPFRLDYGSVRMGCQWAAKSRRNR